MVSISIILYSFSLNLSLPFQFLGFFFGGGFVWISEIGADSMFDFNFRILSVDKKLRLFLYFFFLFVVNRSVFFGFWSCWFVFDYTFFWWCWFNPMQVSLGNTLILILEYVVWLLKSVLVDTWHSCVLCSLFIVMFWNGWFWVCL